MKASTSTRLWFAFVAAILWTGIFLTGFSAVHWLLYLPAGGFVLGSITGICPSQIVINKLLKRQAAVSH